MLTDNDSKIARTENPVKWPAVPQMASLEVSPIYDRIQTFYSSEGGRQKRAKPVVYTFASGRVQLLQSVPPVTTSRSGNIGGDFAKNVAEKTHNTLELMFIILKKDG